MAIKQDEMTTSNNKEAESGLNKTPGGNVNGYQVDGMPEGQQAGDEEWLSLIKQARQAQESYMSGPKLRWAQAYRAYNNQHFSDSKYLSDRWRGRSKLHRPKTRNSVHKADARAANALFASTDIVQTTATNPADPKQQASADICREILNYRLSRSSGKAGLPWFQIAVGAHNDARMTSLCVSKQFWARREAWNGEYEPVMLPAAPVMDEMTGQPAVGQDGNPMMTEPMPDSEIDPATGQTMPKLTKKMVVKEDRPMVELYPIEYCWRDPGAHWVDQAQKGNYVALLHPMSIGDAFAMLNSDANSKSSVQYRPLTKEQLAHCGSPLEVQSTASAREPNSTNRRDIKSGNRDFDTCWLIEWFVRQDGREWHFWTGACMYLASEPVPVEVAYPFAGGERPIVIGYSALEPHKIDPMSPVQAALPLQQEMNDLVNLRMDGVKENVRPLTIVRAGSGIDVNSIQNRSGDSVIYAKVPKEDVVFDRPASIGGEAYEEMAHLNADFDDTTGEFNGASVAMNRQIGETVGGMKLLNTSANVTGDFDLRIWVETWVEPVLRQLMKVIQYYEDDKTILTVAYEKAKLWQKYKVDEITEELLDREIILTVDVGIGTADPAVALEKFAMAAKITASIIGEEAQARVKQDDVINEIFSKAGFKSAAERFFHPGDQTDPRITKLKEALQQQAMELQSKDADRANDIELARIKAATDLLKQYMSNVAAAEQAEVQGQQQMAEKGVDHAHDTKKTAMAGKQRLAEIKAKPAPGGKGAPAKPAQQEEADPLGGDPMMKMLLTAMMGKLAPDVGGELTPPAAQPGGPQQQQGPDPAQAAMQNATMQSAQAQQMIMMQVQQLSQVVASLMQSQQAMQAMMTAPRKIIRGPDGRAEGVQIEGQPPMSLTRAPDGRAVGLQ